MKKLLLLIVGLTLISCSKEKSGLTEVQKKDSTAINQDTAVTHRPDPIKNELSSEEIIRNMNNRIVKALMEKDYYSFADFIHPEKGIRFSMYGYVDPARDKLFSLSDFRRYVYSDTKFTFGARDGSGDIYVTPLKDYLANWVYKRDFAKGKYLFNHFRGEGNSLNNVKEIYPGMLFTENYIGGSEKYSGMDWNSLRFVFDEFNGRYYLVAVVNDEWTI